MENGGRYRQRDLLPSRGEVGGGKGAVTALIFYVSGQEKTVAPAWAASVGPPEDD